MSTSTRPDPSLVIACACLVLILSAPLWVNPSPVLVRIALILCGIWTLVLVGFTHLMAKSRREQKTLSRDEHAETALRMLGAKGQR